MGKLKTINRVGENKNKNSMDTIYKSMKMQREMKKRILNDGGGIYTLEPKRINENEFLFMVKETGIGFFIRNWEDFFKAENCWDLNTAFTVKFEMISIAPKALSQSADSPFLGDAIILEMFETSNRINN